MVGATVDNYLPLSQSLLELQDAADRIFDAIIRRVGSETIQLKNLSARIASAQEKVDALSGTKRATTIYSSAKFPQADPSVTDFVPLFEGTGQHEGKACADTVSLDTGQWQSQEESTLELFRFFSETSHEYWLKDHKHKDGVGKVPPRIKSVADVILFNTSELPYHKYRIVDNLAGADQFIDQEELEVKPVDLPAAPQSVQAGDVLSAPGAEEFGFRPVLRQVPSFSLPSVLPDLPMVAEISWRGVTGGTDQLPSIAPSALHSGTFSPRSNYSASPRFDSTPASFRFDPSSLSTRLESASSSRRFDSTSENDSMLIEKTVPFKSLPPLDVTMTPQERALQSTATRSGSGKSSSASSSSGSNRPSSSLPPQSVKVDAVKVQRPPPPPPPPTPPLSLQSSPARVSQTGRTSSAQQSLPPIDSQRAALMASIRNSGLDLLRKTGRKENRRALPEATGSSSIGRANTEVPQKMEDAKEASPSKVVSPDVKQPVNVMAEMARSLTLRRLSMRGASTPHMQSTTSTDSHATPIDEEQQSIGSRENSKLTLPNLHAYIKEDNEEQSEDDEWD